MTLIEKTFEIKARPEKIWSIIADRKEIPKLQPNVLDVEVDPPGLASVGQKFTFTYRIWRREMKVFGEHVEVVPNRMLKSRQLPQGMFKGFEDTIKLEGFEHLTRVTTILNYQLSMGALGRFLGVLFVHRTIRKDAANYWRNVRRLAELQSEETASESSTNLGLAQ